MEAPLHPIQPHCKELYLGLFKVLTTRVEVDKEEVLFSPL